MHGRPGQPAHRTSAWLEMTQLALCLAATLALARYLVDIPQGPGNASLLVLLYASSACLSSLLVSSTHSPTEKIHWPPLFRRSTATVLVFLTAVAADPGTRGMIFALLPLSVMLFLMVLLTNTFLFAVSGSSENQRPFWFSVVAALFAAAIWLGPLVETTGNPTFLTNAVVAISPLTAFAVSIDLDYLRTSWFYEHSSLGAMRYAYLSWAMYVVILITGLAAVALALSIYRKTQHQSS